MLLSTYLFEGNSVLERVLERVVEGNSVLEKVGTRAALSSCW